MSKAVDVTTENFQAEVAQSDKPVLVDFWAPWCSPCKAIAPVVDKVADSMAEQVKVVKVDIDSHPKLAQQFNVRSIPTLMVFKDGVPMGHNSGMVTEKALVDFINSSI